MNKKAHILVVSQYFYPEQFRINDICREWVRRGYRVTVLTGIPNYPQGKFYTGYGLCKKRKESWNGVEILRLPLVPRGKSSLGLILNYLSFPAAGFLWKCFTCVRADFVFNFETSPMTQSLIAVWYAKKRKIPCYLYVQDLWPENVEIVTGIHHRAVIGPIERMVAYLYRNSDHIFATSPSFVQEIQKRTERADKVSYWPQYAEEFYRKEKPSLSAAIPADGKFQIIFTGNIGKAQGLEILPKAAMLLKDRKIRFIVVGDGRDRENFLSQLKRCGVNDQFLLIERQPPERIPGLLACADAAFVSFMNSELFEKTIPAKLQSYMACGMPILAAAAGETKRIIEEADCGLCSPIGEPKQLADCIEKMMNLPRTRLDEMGRNAEAYCREHFGKKRLMDEMDGYLEKQEEYK